MNEKKLYTEAYGIAETSLATNEPVYGLVCDYLKMHPRTAAEISISALADKVYDIMVDFSLDD